MDKEQNKNFQIIAAIGAGIFLFFISPNLLGAQNAAMLSAFEIDEFAQYPNLIGMLTPGATLYETIRHFLIYLHYFYGYPFYFFSALAVLPVKLIYGQDWLSHTNVIVAVLRQVINVAPMIVSAGLLTFIQTRFRDMWRSIGMFVFLLLIPAVTVNNLWWHPDGLAVLAAVLVLFFLDRDALKLGQSFFIAAAICGVGVGIKYTGVFFALSIVVYIIWAWVTQKYSPRRIFTAAAGFLGVMLLAVVISNPLLLFPQERAALIEYQKLQFQQTSMGILQANPQPYFAEYPADFRYHYGELEFLMMGFAGLTVALFFSKKRWYYAVLLAFIIPMTLTINFSATRRTHYFLPVVLPLVSCLSVLLPGKGSEEDENRVKASNVIQFVTVALMAYQAFLFWPRTQEIYVNALRKEELSPSIAFYKSVLAELPANFDSMQRVVYRDWKVYFPPGGEYLTEMTWDMPTIAYIESIDPDILLLDRENIALYSNPDSVTNSVNPGNTKPIHEFYLAADENNLPGYSLLFENPFGLAFVKAEID
ncbi:MAG: YfhO family protein [Leptolinea sp.]|nr:YfhO family protein [Leptolinea sp.]